MTALYSVRVTLSRESCLSLSALQQPFNVHTVLLGETRYLVMLERHRGFNSTERPREAATSLMRSRIAHLNSRRYAISSLFGAAGL